MHKILEREWAGRTLSIETDKIAKQADGAVLVRYGETVVLVTAVAVREVKERMDFFPLLVNYVEMTYAAGRIPGGFFKREGRPTDREVLSSRLIDRGIRPLFPKGFLNETQVVATVLSSDQQGDPSILGIIGASTALQISAIPFAGPLAGVKVGRVDGAFIINPTTDDLTKGDLDLIVAEEAASSMKGLSSRRSSSAMRPSSRSSPCRMSLMRPAERQRGRTPPWKRAVPCGRR